LPRNDAMGHSRHFALQKSKRAFSQITASSHRCGPDKSR
jgi:hypothetical protein